MKTDLEVNDLIVKLNSSGDFVDKNCAKMLQQVLGSTKGPTLVVLFS
jgi:hypothetical protein